MLDFFYPVGTIYQTADSSFNPNTVWGGTWQKIEGRFLLGSSSAYKVGNTGGEATHALTVAEMPKHNHRVIGGNNGTTRLHTAQAGLNSSSGDKWAAWFGGGYNGVDNVYASETGSGTAHNNMPPYHVVVIWRRTA